MVKTPRTLKPKNEEANDRTQMRLPKKMTLEVDRLVHKFPMWYRNRQQFVESAVREKLETLRKIEVGIRTVDEQHP